ncbi:hypothetical protein GCM10010465_05730 [Actinomadura fibrosa]
MNAPAKAVLVAPLNNKECEQGNISGNTATVDFSWESATDATSYDLKITNLDTQSATTKNNLTGTSAAVSLERGHPYSWQVTAKNSGSKTTASDVWKFYLSGDGESNFAPFPATALEPASGATVARTNGKVTLSWQTAVDPDGDAVTYTLLAADTVEGLQNPPAEWQNLSSTSIEIAVNANTIYYWKVIASDGTNNSTSTVYSFRTE